MTGEGRTYAQMLSRERERLFVEGKRLFVFIDDDLNAMNNREQRKYRREEDFEEICVALALLGRISGIEMEGDH